ncbi:branched-chain amino acid ABC transporter permease [Salipiger abyssi]|nr:branched-chain amino acid ABC transporter permease [Salipiger abyssi]
MTKPIQDSRSRPAGLSSRFTGAHYLRDSLAFLGCAMAFLAAGLVIGENYVFHILILICIWSAVIAGWDLLIGYAGVFNYAQLVFFAVGAYGSAMLSVSGGLPALAAIPLAAGIGGLFGALIAIPSARLKGEYVALFTFAVHLALPSILQQTRGLGTGGSTGILGLPPISLFGQTFYAIDKQAWFLMALIVAVICIYLIYFVVLRSRFGLALLAMRDAPAFSEALGVNGRRYQIAAFAISAAITAFAGAFYAHYTAVVTPRILGTEFFLMAMVMLAIGGMGRFPGALLGVCVVVIGNEVLRSFDSYRLVALGLIVIGSVIFLPDGLGGFLSGRMKKRASSADPT